MKTILDQDTIAAIATPVGEGALAIIRVSGPDAITSCDRVFHGKVKLSEASSFSIHFGRLVDFRGKVIDEVLASVFRSPSSYSGENTVELSCHGGYYITQKVFETILSTGVRHAEPGEFTKRAFLNGRMDLSQAEAVAGLIAAKSETYYRACMYQLEGRFSAEIKALRTELLNLSSLLEIDLDFSEEGIPLISTDEILSRIRALKEHLSQMMSTYENGKRFRDGISVTIVGKPNAGKSSLFNALLSENRAIVSEKPGTTRDFLEESIFIKGVSFRLADTAGLRDSTDQIEAEGITRTQTLMENSDILLCVIDITDSESSDFSVFDSTASNKIIVFNKADIADVTQSGHQYCVFDSVIVSAKNNTGLNELRERLYSSVFHNKTEAKHEQVTSARHYSLLHRSVENLDRAEVSIGTKVPNEFVSTDIHSAATCLAEIVGEITSDDMLNNIFMKFCIGK
ncbi:MAG: tRNA uridine-5-carboxymethylaminomethyl(34) synthesis GTPase MnmE [bacterium]